MVTEAALLGILYGGFLITFFILSIFEERMFNKKHKDNNKED